MPRHPAASSIPATARTAAALLALALATGVALTGCASSDPAPGSSSIIDLIPWARSIADTATAEQISERLDELKTTIPTLGIDAATQAALEKRVTDLADDLAADPTRTKQIAGEVRQLIADVQSAAGR